MEKEDKRFAVLIDAENVSDKYIKAIFDELSNHGVITYKRIYGDWTKPNLASWKSILLNHSITPIQQYSYTSGKNSTDSAMIIDAMDILYSGKVEGFCIVSSDSDFTRLVSRLRESGMYIVGMGEQKTPAPFIAACNKFKYLEIISKDDDSENSSNNDKQNCVNTQVTQLSKIKRAITAIVDETSDESGLSSLSEVGNILQKRYPDFDVRNYGFNKLTKLVEHLKKFELIYINNQETNARIVFIKNKSKK
ncbi:MAG: NYN domain-containing protein [Clostridiales bacterium]|nr:NYN domain-containing protein [Clostridiales bacterium]